VPEIGPAGLRLDLLGYEVDRQSANGEADADLDEAGYDCTS
jgi:hypothetical protein